MITYCGNLKTFLVSEGLGLRWFVSVVTEVETVIVEDFKKVEEQLVQDFHQHLKVKGKKGSFS